MTPLESTVSPKRDKPGIIYLAKNLVNGKCYVGQTTYPLRERKQSHAQAAKHGSRTAFHRALRKYGIDSFEFSELQQCCGWSCLDEAEKWWVEHYASTVPKGYNRTYGGQSRVTPDVRKRLSEARRHQVVSEETRRKLRGRVVTQETREILRANSTGRKHTEETKKRLSEIAKNRSPIEKMKAMSKLAARVELTPKQYKRKMSGLEAYRAEHPHQNLGRKWTPEQHSARKNRICSEETKRKMRNAHRGYRFSEESKMKKSESMKMAWASKIGPWRSKTSGSNCWTGLPFEL